jgi:hypothetical protein
MPLVEDVRASRTGGPEGSGLVVVEGVWGAVAGGPPPVLLVDDGVRRHTIAALDGPPPDDPMVFRASFAVPADLAGRLGEGLALGLGRAELPLTLAEPGIAEPWLQGPPVMARRLTPAEGVAPAEAKPDGDAPLSPTGRFDRGEDTSGRGSIAAAILRATAPPVPPGATVVERSVIAERRARRSEQIAAVMERRARGAEDTAQALTERIAELEARLSQVAAERDLLAAELELQRAATAQAQAAREEAESRLAELIEPEPAAEPDGHEIAAVRGLPGLQEAARAMREQEPAPRQEPAEPADADPFADALAKLRSGREDLAAAVAIPAAEHEPEPEPAAEVAAVAPALREQVVPYYITAQHPRTAWLAEAIAALDGRDRGSAALLVAQLLPHQARAVRRPLVYDLELEGMGPLRVELDAEGSGRVLAREEPSADAAFALRGTPAELATLAAGGAPLWPRGALRTGGSRRPYARLSRKRRRRLSLADLVGAGIALDPGLAVRALACAVPPSWTVGHAFAVTLNVAGRDTCRVRVADGAPLDVLSAGDERRPVVAATTMLGPERARAHDGPDATLGVSQRGLLPLLAQAEPPAEEEPATVVGDLSAATTLLGWFDRVQGLGPRG